jgi:chromosomal replication initiation ATPase DnaA
MKNRQETGIKTARHIARSAQQTIKNKTGINVSVMLYPTYGTIKTPEHMLYKIAIALGMDPMCYKMKTRARDVVELRFIGAHFIRMYFPEVRLQQIAAFFGGQDHSSVISGLMRAYELIHIEDSRFLEKYAAAEKAIDLWLKSEASVYPLAATA